MPAKKNTQLTSPRLLIKLVKAYDHQAVLIGDFKHLLLQTIDLKPHSYTPSIGSVFRIDRVPHVHSPQGRVRYCLNQLPTALCLCTLKLETTKDHRTLEIGPLSDRHCFVYLPVDELIDVAKNFKHGYHLAYQSYRLANQSKRRQVLSRQIARKQKDISSLKARVKADQQQIAKLKQKK